MKNLLPTFSTLLLLFIVIFDPTNVVFGIKNYSFAFFIICNWKKIDGKYVIVPLIFMMVFFISWTVSFLFDIKLDVSIAMWNLKSFLFLWILFFISDRKLFFLSLFYQVTLWLSIFVCFLTLCVILSEGAIRILAEQVIRSLDGFYMYGYREFYSIKYFVLFYRTSSMCVISLGIALVCMYKSMQARYFIHSIIFAVALIVSGTRANMLSCLLIILGTFFFHILFNKKYILLSISFLILFLFSVLILVYLLLNQGDGSSMVKQNHLYSFWEYFKSLPLLVLLLGSGAGTIFFSSGRNETTGLTELSYMELLKNYGFFHALLLIGIFIFPIIKLFLSKKYTLFEKYSISWSYLAYLFIAGTNPLLIGSTGFTTIACLYYICDKRRLDEIMINNKSKQVCCYRKLLKGSS